MKIDGDLRNRIHLDFQKALTEAHFPVYSRHGGFGNTFDATFGFNDTLVGSVYLADNKQSYLHFTNYENTINIIENKSLWLFNLNNSKDVNEYKYPANALNKYYDLRRLSKEKRNEQERIAKSTLFYCSFCQQDCVNSNRHWKEYADYGNGIAIDFKIKDDYLKWKAIYFSEIQYGNLNNFELLLNNMKALYKKYNQYGADFEIHLSPFLALHKEKTNYKWEKEVRLLLDNHKVTASNGDRNTMFKRDKEKENISHFELPLWTTENNSILNSDILNPLPNIVINKVIVGNNMKKYIQVKEYLENLILYKLGYKVEVERSTIIV